MNVNVQCIHCKVRKVFQNRLIGILDKLRHKYEWIIDGTIYFKVQKDDHNMDKVVEVLLSIPGPNIFAKGQDKTFELAANKAIEGIRHQLRKHKERDLGHPVGNPQED